MNRWLLLLLLLPLLLLLLLCIDGCSLPQEQEACTLDQAAQPIVVPLEGVASVAEPIAALPLGLIHEGVRAGCAAVLTEVP